MASVFLNRIDNGYSFDPDQSISDLSSRVIIVTGGNIGLGKESVLQLAKHKPKRLYLGARSKAKYDTAMADIMKEIPDAKVDWLELDLASFSSIKQAAEVINGNNDQLDILMNNAGVMGAPAGTTKEGYETHFGINHMGHALLTKLLMPLLLKTAERPNSDVRIVNVSSTAYMMASSETIPIDNLSSDMAKKHPYTKYGISKLANVLFSRELAQRYPSIKSVVIHPGRVGTSLLDDFFKKPTFAGYFQKSYDWAVGALPVSKGAWSQLWAAAWPNASDLKNGGFYVPVGKLHNGDKNTNNADLAKKLWDWQEAEFVKHGYS